MYSKEDPWLFRFHDQSLVDWVTPLKGIPTLSQLGDTDLLWPRQRGIILSLR